MSEYAIDEQAAGLEGYDGGEYSGDEGGYEGAGYEDTGYEDYGQGAGAEQGFGGSPAEGEFADVEQAFTDLLELGLATPEQVGEFIRANALAAIAPIAQDVEARRQQRQESEAYLDFLDQRFEKVGLDPEKFDDAAQEQVFTASQEMEPGFRQFVYDDFLRKQFGINPDLIPPEQAQAVANQYLLPYIQSLDLMAARMSLARATEDWVLRAGGNTYGKALGERDTMQRWEREGGPRPETIAAMQAGLSPQEAIWAGVPRSPSEAVRAGAGPTTSRGYDGRFDYRKGGSPFEGALARDRGAA
jgi:hypothetical protein